MGSRKDIERDIHQRLVAGDPTAPAELAEIYLEKIVQRISRRYPNLEVDGIIHDVSVDAFFEYVQNPEKYKPEKASLLNYLVMVAVGDLKNKLKTILLRSEKYEKFVEFESLRRNINIEDLDQVITAKQITERLNNEFPEKKEQEFLELMLSGERNSIAYASVLGIMDLDEFEMRKAVKRYKDKIKKRQQPS